MEKKTAAGGKSVSVLRVLLLTVLGMSVACAAAAPFVYVGLGHLRDARGVSAFVVFLIAEFLFFLGAWFDAVLLYDAFSARSYLLADEERLDARTARGEEIHLPLSAVTDAESFMDTLYLYEGKTVHVLSGLGNACQICGFLLDRIAYRPYIPEPEEAWESYVRCRRSVRLHTVGPVLGLLCAVGLNAWISSAVSGGVSGILTPLDILTFLVFLFGECGVLLLSALLLVRRTYVRFSLQYSERLLISALAYPRRQEELDCFPNRTETKYFERYIYRIVVTEGEGLREPTGAEEGKEPPVCSYVLQQFRPGEGGWIVCRYCAFDCWEELYDDLAGTFGDAVFLP